MAPSTRDLQDRSEDEHAARYFDHMARVQECLARISDRVARIEAALDTYAAFRRSLQQR